MPRHKCRATEQSSGVSSCSGNEVLVPAAGRAEINDLAVDGLLNGRGRRDEGSAHRVAFELTEGPGSVRVALPLPAGDRARLPQRLRNHADDLANQGDHEDERQKSEEKSHKRGPAPGPPPIAEGRLFL